MRLPHNIDRSAFRKGEYVGYGAARVWRCKYSRPYWRCWSDKGDYMLSKSLAQVSLNIENWSI